PKKLMHEGMLDATIVLLFILGIVTSLLFYNAADVALGSAALPAWKPISSTLLLLSVAPAAPTWWHLFWWTHVVLLFSFLAYVPHSKHMLIIFAIVNTFFMDLTPSGALKKIDLEKTETFGVNRVEQLSWRQLLDGYACTECGRCTDDCPANATGKPLAPMRTSTTMRDRLGPTRAMGGGPWHPDDGGGERGRRHRGPVLGRLRGIVRRSEPEGCPSFRADPSEGRRAVRHPGTGGEVHRRSSAETRQRIL